MSPTRQYTADLLQAPQEVTKNRISSFNMLCIVQPKLWRLFLRSGLVPVGRYAT
jgi:hypothetical protein